MMKVEAGTELFLSKVGAYGFFYPDESNSVTVIESFDARDVTWIGSLSFKALKPQDKARVVDKNGKQLDINYPVWIKHDQKK